MLTVNALGASNSVLIPVQAQYLPANGLEQLLQTVSRVRRQINPKLQIDGILLTMVDTRTNYAKEISAEGKSIDAHDPNGKVAEAYRELTKEVLKLETQRQKHKADLGR
jgi:chromosome partitioning protein